MRIRPWQPQWMFLAILICSAVGSLGQDVPPDFTNTLGMRMLHVQAGSFTMGSDLGRDYWDERPSRHVTLSGSFFMSETEVTIDQYRQFQPDFELDSRFEGYVSGVSWYEAVEFCQWLSVKESKTYRLPTEAEWEYACRSGTTTTYWSGKRPPLSGQANPWGLRNMHGGVREWCHDWYGEYPVEAQTDPVGPEDGMARVVRGGCLDDAKRLAERKVFDAASSRAAMAPSFGLMKALPRPSEALAKTETSDPRFESGLVGNWFGEPDLSNPKDEEVLEGMDNNWNGDDVRGRFWSARWRGYIDAPHSGEVTFELRVSTGGILQVGGQEIVSQWSGEGTFTGRMEMVKGERYPMVLSYQRSEGNSYLQLRWSWLGEEMQLVPSNVLSHSLEDRQVAQAEARAHLDVAPGRHWIGFRVVQAPLPNTRPCPGRTSYPKEGVRGNAKIVKIGPTQDNPYFRKRYLLPVPLDNSHNDEIDAVGMHPSFRRHNHSPGLEVCPNGDVLMVIYTSYKEYEPGVSLIASRLRFGEDQWDMPDRMFDFAGANDHAPLLWTDGSMVHFFWGNPLADGGFPFQWTSSKDSGATWEEITFPVFSNKIGPHSRQPINTAFRDADGVMYVASDGSGGTSVLWASEDNGKTWYDTEGRSAGRHTTYAILSDGKSILGMGGKNTDIDGYMPKAISDDGGKTWTVSKSSFSAQGNNQRPSVLRLQSGRLFFAGDFQHIRGQKPNTIHQNGSYVALSNDDGKTWTAKQLAGAQPHENSQYHNGHATIGYSVARQAPNGMIHLITTMNHPCLHFEFNEAWILSACDSQIPRSDAECMASTATSIRDVHEYREDYPDGGVKITFWGGTSDDGRFLLHGKEAWYYPSGEKQREATYELGRKVGRETYWSQNGAVQWAWDHRGDATSIWTQYGPNGLKMAESHWHSFMCNGTATLWDKEGRQISVKEFKNGKMQ